MDYDKRFNLTTLRTWPEPKLRVTFNQLSLPGVLHLWNFQNTIWGIQSFPKPRSTKYIMYVEPLVCITLWHLTSSYHPPSRAKNKRDDFCDNSSSSWSDHLTGLTFFLSYRHNWRVLSLSLRAHLLSFFLTAALTWFFLVRLPWLLCPTWLTSSYLKSPAYKMSVGSAFTKLLTWMKEADEMFRVQSSTGS